MTESAYSSSGAVRARFATLTFVTAAFTYALIVFGGIVRITGSGMGCGEDWPLCDGRLIPPFNDVTTLIEWGHRLAAALIGFLILGVGLYATRHRRTTGFSERRIFRWAMVSLGLLIVVVLFGRATVQLELPPSTVVVHLTVALVLLATLLVAGLLAIAEHYEPAANRVLQAGYARWAVATLALGFVVLVLGALVANTGAAPLCSGFPLCNGKLIPQGGALVYLHWVHRLAAFALVVVLSTAAIQALRQSASAAVIVAGFVSLALLVTQVAVAAALVLMGLPSALRGLHLAVGVALWASLVIWAFLTLSAPVERGVEDETSAAAAGAGAGAPAFPG